MDVWNQSEKTEIRADMSKLNFILNDTLMGEQLYNPRKNDTIKVKKLY